MKFRFCIFFYQLLYQCGWKPSLPKKSYFIVSNCDNVCTRKERTDEKKSVIFLPRWSKAVHYKLNGKIIQERPRCKYTDSKARLSESEGAERLLPPLILDFDRSVHPISIRRGADYAHHMTTCHPEFQNFRRPCKGMVAANHGGVLSAELWSLSLNKSNN